MNKYRSKIVAFALLATVYSVSAATTTDDASTLDTSEIPQLKQQVNKTESTAAKSRVSKKDRLHKKNEKMYSKKQNRENANSMNDKPIGTTNGISNNGSTDDTRVGEPINGTRTGTNNSSNKLEDTK